MAKQATVNVNGKEYKLQHPGALWYSQMNDRCTNRYGVLMKTNYVEELLKNVVVEPARVSIASFDEDIEGLEEVVDQIEKFLRGK